MTSKRDEVLEKLRDRWGDARLLSLALNDEGDQLIEKPDLPNARWHMLAIEGEWKGHWMGSFSLNAQTFDEMILNFEAKQVDTLVDYEHNSLNPFAIEAPASGWITALQRRALPNGAEALWGRFEWTPRALGRIEAREYRYLSPVIRFHTPDRVSGNDTGASVPSVALTNQPFLEELPEVTLNSLAKHFSFETGGDPPIRRSEEMNEKEQMAIAVALGLEIGATPDMIIAAAKDLNANASEAKQLDELARALGMEPGTDAATMITTVRALKATQIPAEEADRLRAQAAEAAELRINSAIERVKAEGKITPNMEPWCRALATKSIDEFEDWAKVAPKVVPLGVVEQPGTVTATVVPEGNHLPIVQVNDTFPEKDDPRVLAQVAKLTSVQLKEIKDQGLDPRDWVRYSINSFE